MCHHDKDTQWEGMIALYYSHVTEIKELSIVLSNDNVILTEETQQIHLTCFNATLTLSKVFYFTHLDILYHQT